MTVVFVMQMTVVQIVGVIVVFDGGMAATGAVGMIVMIVNFASHFDSSLSVVEFKLFRLRPYNILFRQPSKQFLLY